MLNIDAGKARAAFILQYIPQGHERKDHYHNPDCSTGSYNQRFQGCASIDGVQKDQSILKNHQGEQGVNEVYGPENTHEPVGASFPLSCLINGCHRNLERGICGNRDGRNQGHCRRYRFLILYQKGKRGTEACVNQHKGCRCKNQDVTRVCVPGSRMNQKDPYACEKDIVNGDADMPW